LRGHESEEVVLRGETAVCAMGIGQEFVRQALRLIW
jgi:hypothetical protein